MVKKIELPTISLPYKFYICYWEDTESDPSWREMSEILKSKPATCVSTGWLVKKNKEVHIIMSDFNFKKDGELSEGGSTTVIPSANILKLTEVKI